MEIYDLGKVQATTDGRADYYGFNIVGILGRPLVTISFATLKEAEAAHITVQPLIAQARLITAHPS
jgi:hypothetical protein